MRRFCIIGAGACGLAVAKSFAERGIPFDCFEALADVGGIWNPESPHVVYGSTYLNSSKKLSRYPDFHFPEEWAHYASRAQAQDYLRAYAKEFGLYPLISFNKRVARAEHTPQGWRIQIEGESAPRSYAGLVIANGHHWEAVVPTYPGHFDGEALHSHDVKSKEQVKGKRVLVVGAGNSAVDILSDAAIENGRVVHSMRRTYYFFPKTVFGKPTDVFIDYTSRIPLPRKVMRLLYRWGMRIVVGPHRRFGLERPDHDLFEAHPTACNTYIDHLIHGRTIVKPGIERLDGKRVIFTDGSEEEIDLLVWATGYRVSFPFIDQLLHSRRAGQLEAVHPYVQPRARRFVRGRFVRAGGRGRVADRRLSGSPDRRLHRGPGVDPKRAEWFRTLKAYARPDIGHGIKWQDTPWHRFEIQHYRFRRYMKRLLRKFGVVSGETVEPRTMQIDGAPNSADAKLKLAS